MATDPSPVPERLLLRCRQSPAWAAAEIERLRKGGGDMMDRTRRPLAQVLARDIPQRLRIDAIELSGWGAGNEAEHARQAADEIERLRALLSRAGIEPTDGHTGSDPAG